jgi:hypothetical protein
VIKLDKIRFLEFGVRRNLSESAKLSPTRWRGLGLFSFWGIHSRFGLKSGRKEGWEGRMGGNSEQNKVAASESQVAFFIEILCRTEILCKNQAEMQSFIMISESPPGRVRNNIRVRVGGPYR